KAAMKQHLDTLTVQTKGPGFYDVTWKIAGALQRSGIGLGVVTCFLRHTSASLVIQENADPDVLKDLSDFMARLVSRDLKNYRHSTEGEDDMPAHIRASLLPVSVSIPMRHGKLSLGTWQGIYLFEHR